MELTKCGQVFYEEEANIVYPEGCKCRDGSCDWCSIYYNGLPDREDAIALMLKEHP